MTENISEKIIRINRTTIDSYYETNANAIVAEFIKTGLQVLEADYGFAWMKSDTTSEYELAFKSSGIPFDPFLLTDDQFKEINTTGFSQSVVETNQSDLHKLIKSYLIIPIAHDTTKFGVMVFCFKQKKKFAEEEKGLCISLGNAVAQALVIHNLNTDLKDINNTLDNTLDSIFIFEPDTLQMSYTNHGATVLTGMTRGAILKKTLHEVISGLSQTDLEDKISIILEDPELSYQTFESNLYDQADKKIPVEISLQHISQKNQPDRFLAIVRDITNRKQTENTIRKMAYYDPLTGLPNRTLLNERLLEAQVQAQQKNNMYALFFVDLDHFKVINDIYGHHVGDLLLNQVARRMQKAIPRKATLARMGGDEFLILLPDLETVEEAQRCAVKIQDVFTEFFELNDQEIYSNGSVGFAIFPLDGVDSGTLLKHADLALHRAKDHGGGNIQQYRIGQPLFYTMQPKLQSELRKAIKRGELVLHYQPVVSLKTKKIIGCEALVRWNHPEMGLIMPGAFIGQAEESGLIVEIGQWVMDEACRQVQQWETSGKTPPPVSINISPRELLRPTLVSNMESCLQKYKISPSQIKVELTETFLMKNIDLSISILEQIKALGLRIMIDDFGTGYASLNYLKQLPIDAVKIDKTFIQGVPVNLQDAALTSAIIAIAHQLGLHVIGEGVENQDQYDFLRAAQCNFAQGNFFYRPLAGNEFAKLLNLG